MTKAADTIKEVHYTNGAVVSGRMIDALCSIAWILYGSECIEWRNGPNERWQRKPQPHGAQLAREIAAKIGT